MTNNRSTIECRNTLQHSVIFIHCHYAHSLANYSCNLVDYIKLVQQLLARQVEIKQGQ